MIIVSLARSGRVTALVDRSLAATNTVVRGQSPACMIETSIIERSFSEVSGTL
jgi:hypothetical protein